MANQAIGGFGLGHQRAVSRLGLIPSEAAAAAGFGDQYFGGRFFGHRFFGARYFG